jgi:hypothetical protein
MSKSIVFKYIGHFEVLPILWIHAAIGKLIAQYEAVGDCQSGALVAVAHSFESQVIPDGRNFALAHAALSKSEHLSNSGYWSNPIDGRRAELSPFHIS